MNKEEDRVLCILSQHHSTCDKYSWYYKGYIYTNRSRLPPEWDHKIFLPHFQLLLLFKVNFWQVISQLSLGTSSTLSRLISRTTNWLVDGVGLIICIWKWSVLTAVACLYTTAWGSFPDLQIVTSSELVRILYFRHLGGFRGRYERKKKSALITALSLQ